MVKHWAPIFRMVTACGLEIEYCKCHKCDYHNKKFVALISVINKVTCKNCKKTLAYKKVKALKWN